MKLKPILSKTLHSLGYATGLSVLRAKSLPAGRILKFHGVGDDDYSAADFESHLHFLARHFSVVSMDSFVRKVTSGKAPRNEIVLTFDDGLRNNLTVAYPILQRLKIPATYFVCPGLIENGRWLWTHEARARLRFLGANQAEFISRWQESISKSLEQFVAWMKTLSQQRRGEVESDLRQSSCGFVPTMQQREKYDLMNWDELRSLDSPLITIGSHTVNHPILANLERDDLAFELSASRKTLEEKIGRPVEYFCYPNGSYNETVLAETRRNYRAAVSTEVGFVTPSSDLHCLPRIGIAQKLPLLAWRLHRPTA